MSQFIKKDKTSKDLAYIDDNRKNANSLHIKNGGYHVAATMRKESNSSASDIGDILNTNDGSMIEIRRGNASEAQTDSIIDTDGLNETDDLTLGRCY